MIQLTTARLNIQKVCISKIQVTHFQSMEVLRAFNNINGTFRSYSTILMQHFSIETTAFGESFLMENLYNESKSPLTLTKFIKSCLAHQRLPMETVNYFFLYRSSDLKREFRTMN